GDYKQQEARDQGQPHERQNQTNAQSGTENPPFALEDEFHEVSDHEKNQQNEQNDVDVDEEKESDITAQGILRGNVGQLHLEEGEYDHHQRGDEEHEGFTLAALGLFQLQALLNRLGGGCEFHR